MSAAASPTARCCKRPCDPKRAFDPAAGEPSIELFVQFLVLAATAALFWFARRDLANRAAPPAVPADTRELEQLCVTLEALVTDLSHRLDAMERRLASGRPMSEGVNRPLIPNAEPPAPESPRPDADPRHAPVYALIQAGETDPQEIVRRTGLARGEVDLILSLRARRAL